MKADLTVIIALALCAPTLWAHSDDFEVGLDPSTNRVKIEYEQGLFPWQLPPSAWPAAIGFALDDPGFVSLDAGEVVPGIFELLNPNSVIALKVLSVSSPEMKLWNPVGPGEPGFQILGNDLWTIGSPFFDNHPVWHIDTADPAYDPVHSPWDVTFQLVDLAGFHLDSEPLTVNFVPEPASLGAAVFGVLVFGFRRQTRGLASF